MKNLSSSPPRFPQRAHARRFWVAGLLPGLLLAHASQAQSLLTTSTNSLVQTGSMFVTGTVQNAGSYTPTSGTLLVSAGDFLNTGTITTAATTGTLLLQEASTTTGHTLSLGGQAIPNLSLNVQGGTTMGSNGTVNGNVTLATGSNLLTSTGTTVGTDDFILTLGSAAALINEANAQYVKGRVAQSQNLTTSTAVDFGKMGVTVNSNGQALSLGVERRAGLMRAGTSFGTNPTSGFKGIDRVWAFNSTTTPASALTITLSWLSVDNNGKTFTGTNAQVWRSG